MNRTILVSIIALFFVSSAVAQGRSSEAIKRQIHDLKAEKIFTLTYDQASDVSKLIAVAGNFDQKQAAA